MGHDTLLSFALVLVFVLIGGVFAATEMALVSLRPSQLDRMERKGPRGARVAALARDPNTFLAAVQIGVTVAGFLSAAYGASTLAPDVAPVFARLGLPDGAANNVAVVTMTLLIAYLSLVLGELVPKRLALQRSAGVATVVAPPLSRFASLMRPVIWLLSRSTDAVVRVLGGDPRAKNEEMSEDELRDLVGTHEALEDDERRILSGAFAATDRTVEEVMCPRGAVEFLRADMPLREAADLVLDLPHSRFPVTGRSVDDVLGFVHVRDLLGRTPTGAVAVRDIVREIPALPGTNRILPAMTELRRAGVHIALVIDEYGGTDGIVTLEDMVEEVVGEIRDEYDAPARDGAAGSGPAAGLFDAGLTIEDFTTATGVPLDDGPYETVAGYILHRLGRIPSDGDIVTIGDASLVVAAMDGRRIAQVEVRRPRPPG
jgi:putative hemolysin